MTQRFSLSKDEVCGSLMVTSCAILSTLSGLVTCVGCRRSVESLHQTLAHTGDTALEPLTIDTDGVVSVNREHIEVETSLANLFCQQVSRLSRELGEGTEGKVRGGRRGGRGGRCSLHSLEVRKLVTMSNWQETWDCMEQECREEVVLLPYHLIRHTLDGYLKKHSFCSECTNMVNKAYTLLVDEGQVKLSASRGRPQIPFYCRNQPRPRARRRRTVTRVLTATAPPTSTAGSRPALQTFMSM